MYKFSLIVFFIFIILHFTTFSSQAQSDFIFGSDLSYANMMEDCGAEFKEDGIQKDIYQIFADNGTNLIRVRLWHNPDWQESLSQPTGVKAQYNNFEDVKETIFRAKLAGMKVMLGFHFSDFWCDPGRQIMPKAWEGVANNETALKDSVYNYVYHILDLLNKEDLMPEYVKIGNENNSGIMTHKGMDSSYKGITLVSNSWARHGQMYNSAIKAVRDISKTTTIKPLIALHVADPSKASWFYNNIISNGVTDFDIMGFTFYYSYHGQSPNEVGQIIKNLKTQHPGYDAMIVETGYLWDTENIDDLGNIITSADPNYQPVSPSTQQKYMVDLSKAVMEAGGSGVIFWEPDWVSTPCSTPWGVGSSQEHVAFFNHRDNLNFLKNGGGGWPDATINGSTPTEVKVTFKVDMTGQDISRGVYIVGQITGWKFVKMELEQNSIYSTSFECTNGDVYAYYYITIDSWVSDYIDYRETVPEECANSDELLDNVTWTTDRAFIVPKHDTILANVWASCETFATAVNLFELENNISIYPNPSSEKRIVIENKGNLPISTIEIVNLAGQLQQTKNFNQNENCQTIIDLSDLKNGIYFIKIKIEGQLIMQKLILN